MKTIFKYLRTHYQTHFKWGLYLYFALVMVGCFYVNYTYNFESRYVNPQNQPHLTRIFAYILFYGVAYFAIAIPQALFTKVDYLRQRDFWIRSLFFLGILGLMAGFWVYRDWVALWYKDYHTRRFLNSLGSNVKSLITIFIPLILFKYWKDRQETSLYGLTRKDFIAKPYLLMLAMMLPLLIWASFQSGFLSMYPMFKPWKRPPVLGLTSWQMFGIYEVVYSWDFINTELIFRGALIIGMARVMKEHSILPMVAVYAFLHFEKPMAEAIGSIFGGYILGVIALYSRSIFGGIIIHLGVALLMDLLAIGQYFRLM